jgi:hypothetical protein
VLPLPAPPPTPDELDVPALELEPPELDVLDVALPVEEGPDPPALPVVDSPQAISNELVHKDAKTKASFRMGASSRDLRRK